MTSHLYIPNIVDFVGGAMSNNRLAPWIGDSTAVRPCISISIPVLVTFLTPIYITSGAIKYLMFTYSMFVHYNPLYE
jgi:hypothetical protein